jgi:hypothetical protein
MPAVSRSGPVSGEVAAGAGRDGAAPAVGGAAAGGAAVGLAAGGAVPPFPVQPASSRPRTRAVTTEPRRLHGNAHADPDTSPPTADIVPGGGRRDQALADDAPIRLLAISAGNGVNPRTAESVPILPQVRERLGLDPDAGAVLPAGADEGDPHRAGRSVLQRRHRHVHESPQPKDWRGYVTSVCVRRGRAGCGSICCGVSFAMNQETLDEL